MPTVDVEGKIQVTGFTKEELVAASADIVWESILEELGPESQMPDGTPMPFKLEAWPGGRWFRDLGNNTGHLWGHVQVIKPPKLLEITGPMFMSYPAVNFSQYKLVPDAKGTKLIVTHRAMGLIPDDHLKGMREGWDHWFGRIRTHAEKKLGAKK